MIVPRLSCLCGESFSLSPIPNPQGFKLIWEPLMEKLIEELVSARKQATSDSEFEDKVYRILYLRNPELTQIYECPHCGRLIVFTRASDSEPAFWFRRDPQPEEKAGSLRDVAKQGHDSPLSRKIAIPSRA